MPTIKLLVGASINLGAQMGDQNLVPMPTRQITWSSGTPGVATVDQNGRVTGVTAGTATITATDVATGTITATQVVAPYVPVPTALTISQTGN